MSEIHSGQIGRAGTSEKDGSEGIEGMRLLRLLATVSDKAEQLVESFLVFSVLVMTRCIRLWKCGDASLSRTT